MSTFTANERQTLPRDQVLQKLQKHPLWTLTEDGKLSRKFRAKNLQSAMDFVAAVGAVANKYKHHPDISVKESKMVEILVYTQGVNGVTEMDFKMIELYDRLPVNYSLAWKKHNEALIEKLPVYDELTPATNAKETEAAQAVLHSRRNQFEAEIHHKRGLHDEHDGIHPTIPNHGDLGVHPDHSETRRSDGSLLHTHSFKVSKAHVAPLGDSEVLHNMDHLHEFNDSNHVRVNLRGLPPADLKRGFALMVHGLETYERLGYEVGMCEEFLPMFDQNTIIPGYSEDLKKAYLRVKHRGGDWSDREPQEIVEASQEFLEGYGLVSKVYVNLADVEKA